MKKVYLFLALICLLLTGCGGDGQQAKEGLGNEGQRNEGQGEGVPSGQNLPIAGSLTEANPWYVKEVKSIEFQEPEEGYEEQCVHYEVLGDKIYMLRAETAGDGSGSRLCVQYYDIESESLQQSLIQAQVPGHENSSVFSIDLTAGLELSLEMGDEGEGDARFLVRMNLDGDILTVLDAIPEEYPWNTKLWESAVTTQVFDLADGRTVLCRYDSADWNSRLTWYGEARGEEPLGALEDEAVHGMMLGRDGMLYYLGNSSLVRWNVEENTREALLDLHVNRIDAIAGTSGLAENDKGELLICQMSRGKGTIYVLTDEELADGEKIRLCSLERKADDYYNVIATTFRQNGGRISIDVEYEEKWEYREDYRNRILAEMVAGGGPDMLLVSHSDMILLQEKGMICDLSGMVSPEIKQELIPAVVELGSADGEWVGMVVGASFATMSTVNQTWDKDSWTLQEFIELLESRDDWVCPFNYMGHEANDTSLLYDVFLHDLTNSSVLDLEQGISHFDSDEFTHILELSKKYGARSIDDTRFLSDDECIRLLEAGNMVGNIHRMYEGLVSFSEIMRKYGEDFNLVGFPTQEGSGNYVDSYSFDYLVINARTEHMEEIKKYLALLLDYDNQFTAPGCSVRMDVIRNYLSYGSYGKGYVMRYTNDMENPQYKKISLKPDGTTYFEEFLAFVESCGPEPYSPPQVSKIIGGEILPFLEGRKSAEDAARIIQGKMELYLSEIK